MEQSVPGPARIAALDVLRGLAVGGMLLSGQLPRAVLPGWMYHAQNPPPAHVFTPALPGLTWVDLVFPLFLFALGAAIPLAMGPKLASGQGWVAAAGGVLRRALLLALFAILVRHLSPHVAELGAPWMDACYALAGLAALFAILAPVPAAWSRGRGRLLRVAGWGAACALMFVFRDAAGGRFSPARSDIILLVLANVSLGAGLLYLCTRERPLWRLGVLALLLALRLGKEEAGWAHWLWEASPIPWLAPVAFQQYLFVAVPGMFAGEWLSRLAHTAHSAPSAPPATRRLVALSCLGLVAVSTFGLYARAQLGQAALALLLIAGACAWFARKLPRDGRRLLATGLGLMLFGLAFDPFEGGTQKGVATLSYYLVGAAAGSLMLLALLLVEPWRAVAALLTGAGQNPLFAYIGLHLLVTPLLVLSGLAPLLQAHGAIGGSLRAFLLTLLVCAIAGLALRRRLPLRI